MIRVNLQSDTRGRIRFFSCQGHAELTVCEEDDDLLCAGVSALCGALTIGLVQVVGASVVLNEDYGLFHLELEEMDEEKERQSQVLLQTTVKALEELAAHNVGFIEVVYED